MSMVVWLPVVLGLAGSPAHENPLHAMHATLIHSSQLDRLLDCTDTNKSHGTGINVKHNSANLGRGDVDSAVRESLTSTDTGVLHDKSKAQGPVPGISPGRKSLVKIYHDT